MSPTFDIQSKEYNTIHFKIRRQRGRAHEQTCVDCGGSAMDWSHRHNTDPMDIVNYDPRCRACHFRYDGHWIMNQDGDNFRTAKLTRDSVTEIRECYAAGGISQRRLAAEYGVAQTTIGRIVRWERWR